MLNMVISIKNEQDKSVKQERLKPLSLEPLTPEQALRAALLTPPPEDEKKPKKRKSKSE